MAATRKDKYRLRRLIDKWCGSALLLFLGLFRRRRAIPASVRSIALMKADGLGDLVMVTAVARDIRVALPETKIVLVCGPFNYPLASILSDFDEIVCLSLSNPITTVRKLRGLSLDVFVDMGEWSRIEALLAFFSRAKWTVGFNTRCQCRHYAHDMAVTYRTDQHEIENFKALVRAFGVPTPHAPQLTLKDDIRRQVDQMAAPDDDGQYAVAHLWSGSDKWGRLKEWPSDRWSELLAWLNKYGLRVLLTGGATDVERAVAFAAACSWNDARVRSIAGQSFPELIRVLRGARIVVSIDTSITHLAGALGVAVLSLHGHSSSKRWGPVGPRAEAIDSTCAGCGYMNWGADSTRRKAKLKCMEAISVAAVVDKVGAMLE